MPDNTYWDFDTCKKYWDSKSDSTHNHNTLYYSKTQIDTIYTSQCTSGFTLGSNYIKKNGKVAQLHFNIVLSSAIATESNNQLTVAFIPEGFRPLVAKEFSIESNYPNHSKSTFGLITGENLNTVNIFIPSEIKSLSPAQSITYFVDTMYITK